MAKKCTFLEKKKKGTKNFTTPHSIPIQSVLYQNKTSHNFDKRVERPIAESIEDLGKDIEGLGKGLPNVWLQKWKLSYGVRKRKVNGAAGEMPEYTVSAWMKRLLE